jgi:hypothetical protein
LTNGLSRKLENDAAFGLYFAAHNIVTTPAVAAGIDTERWTVGRVDRPHGRRHPPLPLRLAGFIEACRRSRAARP